MSLGLIRHKTPEGEDPKKHYPDNHLRLVRSNSRDMKENHYDSDFPLLHRFSRISKEQAEKVLLKLNEACTEPESDSNFFRRILDTAINNPFQTNIKLKPWKINIESHLDLRFSFTIRSCDVDDTEAKDLFNALNLDEILSMRKNTSQKHKMGLVRRNQGSENEYI